MTTFKPIVDGLFNMERLYLNVMTEGKQILAGTQSGRTTMVSDLFMSVMYRDRLC